MSNIKEEKIGVLSGGGERDVPWIFFVFCFFCLGGAGCKKCVEEPHVFGPEEPTRSKRSVARKSSPLGGVESRRATIAGYRSVLVQPLVLGGQEIAHRPYVFAYYTRALYEIGSLVVALNGAPDAEPSTCKPHWRLDLAGPKGRLLVTINKRCGRLTIGGRHARYTKEVDKIVGLFLSRAVRRPTHRIVRLQVPILYRPREVHKLLRTAVVTTYLPGREFGRSPRVKVSMKNRDALPSDYTKLDESARNLRRETINLLKRYARGLLDTHAEVEGYEGPYPIQETFGRDLRVHYGVTIFFKSGTDALTMRYHCSHLQLHIDEVKVPKRYRVDVVFQKDKNYREVRRLLSKLADKGVEDKREELKKRQGDEWDEKTTIPRITIWKRSRR